MKQTAAKQYAKIRPLFPVQRGNVRTSTIDFINAVLHVLENGCKWRALPERFGKWSTVYARFRRWSRSGVLERLFAALREQGAAFGCVVGLAAGQAKNHCLPTACGDHVDLRVPASARLADALRHGYRI